MKCHYCGRGLVPIKRDFKMRYFHKNCWLEEVQFFSDEMFKKLKAKCFQD